MISAGGTLAAWAASALLAAAALAVLFARRGASRRRDVAAWLAGGVEVFAGAGAPRWISGRVLTARIEQAAPPFLALAFTVRLDPTGLARVPLPGRLGRRLLGRDRLVVQSDLTRAPRAEFDLVYAGAVAARDARAAAEAGRARMSEVGGPGRAGVGPLLLAEPAPDALAPREAVLGLARRIDELSAEVRRVAVRRRSPHLLAEVEAPGATGEVSAQALFDLLREAAYVGLGPAVGVRRGSSGPSPDDLPDTSRASARPGRASAPEGPVVPPAPKA